MQYLNKSKNGAASGNDDENPNKDSEVENVVIVLKIKTIIGKVLRKIV